MSYQTNIHEFCQDNIIGNPSMLKIVEIFKSIQGEGIDIGLPMVFVRFYGCNLKCKWCDTTYASRKGKPHKLVLAEDVFSRVREYEETAGVCLTGGEPFLQDKASLEGLIFVLAGQGYFIDIQTNGSIFPEIDLKYVNRLSISPKLSSSGNPAPNINILRKFYEKYGHKICLKFVIGSVKDWKEMEDIVYILRNYHPVIAIQPNIPPKKADIFVEQRNAFIQLFNLLNKNSEFSAEYNIRVIPQVHKLLWGNTRKR